MPHAESTQHGARGPEKPTMYRGTANVLCPLGTTTNVMLERRVNL
jgi:hypothetical protein